jgi:uncharacterized protein YqjF (DUF2071 family)
MEAWVPFVLGAVDHRPWPLPDEPWVMLQSWHELLFAHWPVPIPVIRDLIPATLQIETFAGEAWVGVVPFRMTGVRPRLIPALPWFSAFPELNVRTYVKSGEKPGVWFFSLDATNRIAVEMARTWYKLPYFVAEIAVRCADNRIHYSSRRKDKRSAPAELIAYYHATGEVRRAERGSLEEWLTARYCLYAADHHQQLYRAEIHHLPWPLQPAEAEFQANSMAAPLGITLPDIKPLLHFARRLDVIIWNRKTLL